MSDRLGRVVAIVLIVLTEVHLLLGTFGGIERLDGKGYIYRLVFNTVLMFLPPVIWWWRKRSWTVPGWPWALVVSSFTFDAFGNQANLYDSWDPWDNLSHFVTWFLLLWGIGLFLSRVDMTPRWVLPALITGFGALFAVVWEGGEYITFIRQGTELKGAYQDTLSDQLLGTCGAAAAAYAVHLTRGTLAGRP